MSVVADKYNVQRGEILRALVPWYGKSWMHVRTLQGVLADLRLPLSVDDLTVHLAYLDEAQLIELQRYENNAALPSDAGPGAPHLVKLTGRGLLMYDGKIPCDPGVRF